MAADWYRVAEKLASILGDVVAGELQPTAGAVVEVLDSQAAAEARTAQRSSDNVSAAAVRMLRQDLFGRGGTCAASYKEPGADSSLPCMLPIGHEGAHMHVKTPIDRIRWCDSNGGPVYERVHSLTARELEL